MNTALTYTKIKDFQKAIDFQEKCLSVFKNALPKDHPYQQLALNTKADIYNSKGVDAYYKKDYSQAIEAYQRALKVSNELEVLQSNIGMAYTKNKQFKEANEAFTAYEKLFPSKGITFRNWAVYYALQDEKEKALENLKKAVELGYDDMEWLKTDDSMDGLRNETAFIEIVQKLEQSRKE